MHEAMAKVAQAVNGTWKAEGKGYLLIRTSEQIRAEAKEEQLAAAEFVREAQALKREQLPKGAWDKAKADATANRYKSHINQFKPDADWFWKYSLLQAETPVYLLLNRLLVDMDPTELGAIPSNVNVVWSTRPHKSQRLLNPRSQSLVAGFESESELWREARLRGALQSPVFGGRTFALEGIADADRYPGTKLDKVLLVLSRRTRGDGFEAELSVADAKGHVLAKARGDLRLARLANVAGQSAPGEPTISPSAEGAEMAKAFAGGPEVPLSDGLRERLLHPEEYDPLALDASEAFLRVAKIKGLSLVACLSDDAVVGIFDPKARPLPLSRFLEVVQRLHKVSEERGWMIVKPKRSLLTRQNRVDRRNLGLFLRRAVLPSRLSIEEQATFARRFGFEVQPALMFVVTILLMGPDESFSYLDNPAMKLYASLNAQQRQGCLDGGIRLSGLTPDQLDLMARLIHRPSQSLNVNLDAIPPTVETDLYFNGIRSLPTESMPNGLPQDGLFSIADRQEEVAIRPGERSFQLVSRETVITPRFMALGRLRAQQPDLFPGEKVDPAKWLRFIPGQRRTIELHVLLTPIVSARAALDELRIASGGPVAYEALSPAYRKAVDAEMEKEIKNVGTLRPGLQKPPPPR